MKIIALIISLFGIFILGLLIIITKPVDIDNLKDLDNLEINTKVELEGRVVEERVLYEGTKLMKINDLEVICECSGSFKGEDVRIEGMVEEYNNKKQVEALRVEALN